MEDSLASYMLNAQERSEELWNDAGMGTCSIFCHCLHISSMVLHRSDVLILANETQSNKSQTHWKSLDMPL